MSTLEFNCAQCRKRVSVEGSLAGRASVCPHCQEWVKVPDATLPEPPMAESVGDRVAPVPSGPDPILAPLVDLDLESPPPRVGVEHGHEPHRGSVALGGWSCLVIAMLLMVFARPAFFVYLPLVVVAFVLGIVTMAKGYVFSGQLLLIGTLVLPVLVAMKFLGVELSEIPHLDQWVQMPEEVPARAVEEAPVAVAESSGESVMAFPSFPPVAERDAWTGQETEMEATLTEVESDWDQRIPDQEPNWEDRVDYWADQYRGRFVAPKPGMYVKLRLLTGGGAEGTLRSISSESVTLQVPRGSVTYTRSRLAPESRRTFFAEDFARHYAMRKVGIEKDQFQSRRDWSGDGMSRRL